jgi:hypothetical protein
VSETKKKLRSLRDKLAAEAPRAKARAKTPPELIERLSGALEQVGSAYLLATSPPQSSHSSTLVEEVIEDAIVEAHLALHDWERLLAQQAEEQAARAKPRFGALAEQRQHHRQDTNVSVRLLRHAMTETGSGVALQTETTNRPARNVSLGGLFVNVPPTDLPEVRTGHVLHVAIETTLGATLAFKARAVVMRRDATGLGLCWIEDSERVHQSIESLMAALSRSRLGA